MLAALLLNPVVVVPPTRPSDGGAGRIDYVWPPPGYELDVDREIERQERITRAEPTPVPVRRQETAFTPRYMPPLRARAVEAVERRLIEDLVRDFDILKVDAAELLRRRKAEYLAEQERQDDEEALLMILLAME